MKKKSELQARIRARQDKLTKEALGQKGDSGSDVKDPTDAGTRDIPKDPEQTQANSTLPEKEPVNTDGGEAGKTLENASAETSEAGTGAPAHKTEPSVTTPKAAALLKRITEIKEAQNKEALGQKGDEAPEVKDTAAVSKPEAKDTDSKGTVNDNAENEQHSETRPSENAGKADSTTTADKAAGEEGADVEIPESNDFHVRIASILKLAHLGAAIVEDQENFKKAEEILSKHKGNEIAASLLKSATDASKGIKAEKAQEDKLREVIASASDEDRLRLAKAVQLDEVLKHASAEEVELAQKVASVHEHNMKKYASVELKQAYAAGMEDSGVAMDAMAGMEEAGMEEMPEPSIEDIIMLLEQLVAQGVIPGEIAAQIAAELSGGEAPAEEAPVEEASADEAAAIADEAAKVAAQIAKK